MSAANAIAQEYLLGLLRHMRGANAKKLVGVKAAPAEGSPAEEMGEGELEALLEGDSSLDSQRNPAMADQAQMAADKLDEKDGKKPLFAQKKSTLTKG